MHSQRELAYAERDFASLVTSFVSGYRDDQRPFVIQLCKSWLRAWLQHPVVSPTNGEGVRLLQEEIYRARWRSYYQENRENILQRHRVNYQRRKSQ